MTARILRWIRDRPVRSAALALVIAVLALNVLAFLHAYSMTHFVEDGGRIASPESMTTFEKAGVLVFGVRIPKPNSLVTPQRVGLSFEVHHFESPDGLEYEAWFVPNSKSDLLGILFHGYGESKSNLLDEAKAFHELGMNVLLVDFRGAAGGSSGFETTIGFREADDVVAAMAYAQDQFTHKLPVLYGRSMGSAAILRAISSSETEVRGVVLESPFDRLLSTVKNRFSAMGIPSFPCSELLVFWGGVQQGYSGFAHNPAEYASRVDCPALVLHGACDTRSTLRQAQTVFHHLAGEKRFVTFENAGHEPCLKIDPQRWKKEVGDFIGRVAASTTH